MAGKTASPAAADPLAGLVPVADRRVPSLAKRLRERCGSRMQLHAVLVVLHGLEHERVCSAATPGSRPMMPQPRLRGTRCDGGGRCVDPQQTLIRFQRREADDRADYAARRGTSACSTGGTRVGVCGSACWMQERKHSQQKSCTALTQE